MNAAPLAVQMLQRCQDVFGTACLKGCQLCPLFRVSLSVKLSCVYVGDVLIGLCVIGSNSGPVHVAQLLRQSGDRSGVVEVGPVKSALVRHVTWISSIAACCWGRSGKFR